MPAKTLMVQGTASHVGKSVLVTALCRLFHRRGLRVAPFKAQNMSNNSFVTPDGREIGRAQAVQAAACGLEPQADFNPILIKPADDRSAQLLVNGRVAGTLTASTFGRVKREHAETVKAAWQRLRAQYDLVIIEGAGSPAEINLRSLDVVNMYTARLARAPVLLVGDIDRGGVFAALVGTIALLTPAERRHIKGIVINKFRGDRAVLSSGVGWLTRRTHVPCLGIVPYWEGLGVPEEDSLGWTEQPATVRAHPQCLTVGVADLPALSNSTDFEALGREPDVRLRHLSGDTDEHLDALIFPGTKHTATALRFVRARGLDRLARRIHERKGLVVGICGGYQLLGRTIRDPHGVESAEREIEGLGLLDVATAFSRQKVITRAAGQDRDTGCAVLGYRIHMGRTRVGPGVTPWLQLHEPTCARGYLEGARSPDGLVFGTYLHGVFDAPEFRRTFLNRLRSARGWPPLSVGAVPSLTHHLDRLADLVEQHLSMDRIERIVAAGV